MAGEVEPAEAATADAGAAMFEALAGDGVVLLLRLILVENFRNRDQLSMRGTEEQNRVEEDVR